MENESIIALISLSLTLLIFFISEDLIKTFNNSKKALSNPRSMTSFLLKLFSNGFETSISFISKDLAETFVVEKKNIFRARIIKRIYSLFKKSILNLNSIVMNKNLFTYKKSGVNINAADKFVNFIANISSKKKGNKKLNNIGGFGSISDLPSNIKRPKIVACTDGVGTKIEIANLLNNYDTIGIDLVAMSVNDLIVQGAKPIFFLDYISINKIDLHKLKSIIKGIIKGCNLSDCELVGGETAEMPETYEKGKFDIAGFAVGIVDEKKILNKRKIKKNDLVLAVPSSGLHSNGFSLVRYLLKKKKNKYKK